MDTFLPRQIFVNKNAWLNLLEWVRPTAGFVRDCVEQQAIDVESQHFVDRKKLKGKCVFNGKLYDSWEILKSTKFENYSGVKNYKQEVTKIIGHYLELGILTKVEFDEKLILNPINLINPGTEGQRLVLHAKVNCVSKDFNTSLDTVKKILPSAGYFQWACTKDLIKAFTQYPLHEKSKRIFSFEFDNEYFIYNQLVFGYSPAVHIVQTINLVFINWLRLKGHTLYLYWKDYSRCKVNLILN